MSGDALGVLWHWSVLGSRVWFPGLLSWVRDFADVGSLGDCDKLLQKLKESASFG